MTNRKTLVGAPGSEPGASGLSPDTQRQLSLTYTNEIPRPRHADVPTVYGKGYRIAGRDRYRLSVQVDNCPRCGDTHEHHGFGIRTAACNQTYKVEEGLDRG